MLTLVNRHIPSKYPYQFVDIKHAWFSTINGLNFNTFWILQVWRLVSRGYFLPICHSFLPPFQRVTKCPTSPPVSPSTHPCWWASCLQYIPSHLSVHRSARANHELSIIFFFFMCVHLCLYMYVCVCWVAEGSGCSAKMSGQEESGSWAGRQQCWSSYPTFPRLHTVRHT